MSDAAGSSNYPVNGTLDRLEEVDYGREVLIEFGPARQLINLKTSDIVRTDSSAEAPKLERRIVQISVLLTSRAQFIIPVRCGQPADATELARSLRLIDNGRDPSE